MGISSEPISKQNNPDVTLKKTSLGQQTPLLSNDQFGSPWAKFDQPPTKELINEKKRDEIDGIYIPVIGIMTQTTGQR